MARRKQSRGSCEFCGKEMTKGGLAKHLRTCKARTAAIDTAAKNGKKKETLLHLLVQDRYGGDFWLHLEMKADASLQSMDRYLRAIWLECCGHLSRFSVGGWRGSEIPMSRKAQQVFKPDLEVTHIYDFGSSSETLIRAVDRRVGVPLSKHPIYLMARNNQPEAVCAECGEPATMLCMECMYETDDIPTLCDAHAETHPHDEYGEPFPLVNSPRVGMCGYEGPADPPY